MYSIFILILEEEKCLFEKLRKRIPVYTTNILYGKR